MISRVLAFALLVGVSEAGHADMFSCRRGECPVTELTDSNWNTKLAQPHFIMFYAPWCGHCKQLAPKLKEAGKALADVGVKIGACDVEPNPTTQGKFPDIRGFPTLKFVTNPSGKKSVDYNGPREADAIAEFAKQESKKAGVVLGEAVPVKGHTELYSFFGRAALDGKPALFAVGKPGESEPPAWLGKAAAELRVADKAAGGESPEAKTKELLKEARAATKLGTVKEGIDSLLEALDMADKNPQLGPPVVTPGFSSDAATAEAFGLAASELPALFLAAVDRKTGAGTVVPFSGSLGRATKPKELAAFARAHLDAAAAGPERLAAAAADAGAKPLPEFPKPASVLAAEARAAKKAAEAGSIAAVGDQKALAAKCYELQGKTCVLVLAPGGAAAAAGDAETAALAKKYSRDGFAFGALDVDDAQSRAVADALLLGDAGAREGVVVVKGGKRPRVAKAVGGGGAAAAEALLDSIAGGGASFEKLAAGLPSFPEDDAAAADDDGGFDADEL